VPRNKAALHALLQSVDLFSIWTLILLVIGFSLAAKVSRKSAAAVVIVVWILFVLGKVGFAALFT
jgi:FtsH-binding integral membrane protein